MGNIGTAIYFLFLGWLSGGVMGFIIGFIWNN